MVKVTYSSRAAGPSPCLNEQAPWSLFDPDAYFNKNYRRLRKDDAQILRLTCQHFVSSLEGKSSLLRGIDVGAGVNLYPSMAMQPFCSSITLYEHAEPVLAWLEHQRKRKWADSWSHSCDAFDRHLWRCGGVYRAERGEGRALARLTDSLSIQPGNIYDLMPDDPWDLGTMFFVAESITEDRHEFEVGIDRFLGALKPQAPFVIAFMEHRRGYKVAGRKFPSTDIDKSEVELYLRANAKVRDVERIGRIDEPLDDDPYTGMLVACGWAK